MRVCGRESVFADATLQRQLGRTAYHGTVTWSWQQALLAAGLERQIARSDLPADTSKRLRAAHERLWSVIAKTRELRASELWSWRYVNGRFEPRRSGRTPATSTNRTPRSSGAPFTGDSRDGPRVRGDCVRQQSQRESRAAIGAIAMCDELATQLLGENRAGMQSEAMTVFLGGESELEQTRQSVRVDSDAGVLDLHQQLAGLTRLHAQGQRAAAFEELSARDARCSTDCRGSG